MPHNCVDILILLLIYEAIPVTKIILINAEATVSVSVISLPVLLDLLSNLTCEIGREVHLGKHQVIRTKVFWEGEHAS